MTTATIPEFSYNDPPHWSNPALIDWHIYDHTGRISVATLVRKANELQRQVKELQKQQETA